MKKQMLLIIMFTSILNGGDMVQFKDMSPCKYEYNEMPQPLAKSINSFCENYIEKTASMAALYGAKVGISTSTAWFYCNPDTITATNIFVAIYGTMVVSSLFYVIQNNRIRSDIRSYKQTLQALIDNHDGLLATSLLSVGASGPSIPPVNVFQEKKEKLENLFQEPQYKGPKKESDRYTEILNLYSDREILRDLCPVYYLDKDLAAINRIEKLLARNDEAETHCLAINEVIFKTKDAFLTQIISDATVKKSMELNLTLHKSLYKLHEQMRTWLLLAKDTDEYKKIMQGEKELPTGNTIADSSSRLRIMIEGPPLIPVMISGKLYLKRNKHG